MGGQIKLLDAIAAHLQVPNELEPIANSNAENYPPTVWFTLGRWAAEHLNIRLTFNFLGLLVASVIFNIPFLVQPVQRAFEAIPRQLCEAAAVSGLSTWQTFWRVELPLAWPGVLSAIVLTFVHTLGEFGVVLMIGGSIPGETKTIAIAIYDRVQAFDLASADRMALLLLLLSLGAVGASFFASARMTARR